MPDSPFASRQASVATFNGCFPPRYYSPLNVLLAFKTYSPVSDQIGYSSAMPMLNNSAAVVSR
jgi:hypothetical protein